MKEKIKETKEQTPSASCHKSSLIEKWNKDKHYSKGWDDRAGRCKEELKQKDLKQQEKMRKVFEFFDRVFGWDERIKSFTKYKVYTSRKFEKDYIELKQKIFGSEKKEVE